MSLGDRGERIGGVGLGGMVLRSGSSGSLRRGAWLVGPGVSPRGLCGPFFLPCRFLEASQSRACQPAGPSVGWPADCLACPPGLPAGLLAGRPADQPVNRPPAWLSGCMLVGWAAVLPARWPAGLAACLPGCLLSQSTSSQHPVNIQSTSSQHPVNMRRETNETINIFYTAEEQAGVAIPASLIYY